MQAATTGVDYEQEFVRRARRLVEMGQEVDLRDADRYMCSIDPMYWMANYGLMIDPDSDDYIIPFSLWPEQVLFADKVQQVINEFRRLIVLKSRKVGATWIILHLIVHAFIFNKNSSALVGSRVKALVDDGTVQSQFGKMDSILKRQPEHIIHRDEWSRFFLKIVNNMNGSTILGQSTNAHFGRQGRYRIAFLDEFAAIHPALQKFIVAGLTSVAKTIIYNSTPNGTGNKFHSMWTQSDDSSRFEMGWRANPESNDEWFESLLLSSGGDLSVAERAIEYDCSFEEIMGHRVFQPVTDVTFTEIDSETKRVQVCIGGMDFGAGPSLTYCLLALLEERNGLFNVSVVKEKAWSRIKSETIGFDVVNELGGFGGPKVIYADPTCNQAHHDQKSWESVLTAAGVPLYRLGGDFSEARMTNDAIAMIQEMMADGRLKIHIDCSLLLDAMNQWQWDVPKGIDLEMVNRVVINRMKNWPSHCCDALIYLIMGLVHVFIPSKRSLPANLASQIDVTGIAGPTLAEWFNQGDQ